jgi:sorting nexin-8
MRDLFMRHDRLSGDQVDKLRKKIDVNGLKLESIKSVQKDGWQVEADRISGIIEKDQSAIATQLHRRIFIRAWYAIGLPFVKDLLTG